MEPKKKQTRKSVPRPNSGRRAVDGATDLVKVGVRLTAEQHAWVKAHGNDGLRRLIQIRIDTEQVVGNPLLITSVSDSTPAERTKLKIKTDWGSLTVQR